MPTPCCCKLPSCSPHLSNSLTLVYPAQNSQAACTTVLEITLSQRYTAVPACPQNTFLACSMSNGRDRYACGCGPSNNSAHQAVAGASTHSANSSANTLCIRLPKAGRPQPQTLIPGNRNAIAVRHARVQGEKRTNAHSAEKASRLGSCCC